MSVINFRDKVEEAEPLIWMCECGNCSFMIYEDGRLECVECNKLASDVTAHHATIRKWTRKGKDTLNDEV